MSRSNTIQAVASRRASMARSPARPLSPTFSETTNASQMNLGADGPEKVITRANLKASSQAYDELIKTSANYRAALLTMSKASAAFAEALENCSVLKGATYESATRLQAASGLHHLMSNHWHVLTDTVDKNFERPLRQYFEDYKRVVAERSANYEKALRDKSRIIRNTEAENMNIGRKKQRNLQTFREALAVLQRQVDELDELKVVHYQEILEHEEEVWDYVQGKVSLVVRSSLDVFDRFAAKASDPVLEPMLQSIPDPFDSYGPPKAEDQIFSILPPLDILNNAPSPSPSPMRSTPEVELAPTVANGTMAAWIDGTQSYESTEWQDAVTPPRSMSPPTPPASQISSISPRRNSHPTSATHGRSLRPQRASETKLRKVLSAIDESQSGGSRSQHSSDDTIRAVLPDLMDGPIAPDTSKWLVSNRKLAADESLMSLTESKPDEVLLREPDLPISMPNSSGGDGGSGVDNIG